VYIVPVIATNGTIQTQKMIVE